MAIGCWIPGDFDGDEYIFEAVTVLEKVCFQMAFHCIEIRCSSFNKKSLQVPRLCAYELGGVLKQNVIENGKFRNTFVFGILDPKKND